LVEGWAHCKLLCTQDFTNTEETHIYIHAPTEIRTQDFGIRAVEDSRPTHLRFRVYSDQLKIKIYKCMISSHIVLYECGTCYVTLMEEHRLSVLVPREIFEPNRGKVTEGFRELHNK
jgi:hypothetical protein